MDYLPFMRYSLTEPLVQKEADGVKDVISLMDRYDIIKEDFDNIMDITKWPNSKDPMSKLDTKVGYLDFDRSIVPVIVQNKKE